MRGIEMVVGGSAVRCPGGGGDAAADVILDSGLAESGPG